MKTNEIMEKVTNKMLEMINAGVIPWAKPWTGANGAYSRATGKNYSLLNQFGLEPGEYATFNQIKKEGGKVNKGATAKWIVFWKPYPVQVKDENGHPATDNNGNPVTKTIPVLKYFNVFNIEKDTNLKPKWNNEERPQGITEIADLEELANDYFENSGVHFSNIKQDKAFYSPASDSVTLPDKEQFSDTAEYYSTLFHEIGHSTGHSSRLDRFSTDKIAAHGEDYGREELVAEMTACGVLTATGHNAETSDRNSAAYLQGWKKAIKEDNGAIIWAATRAEKAINFIFDTANA